MRTPAHHQPLTDPQSQLLRTPELRTASTALHTSCFQQLSSAWWRRKEIRRDDHQFNERRKRSLALDLQDC
ncbi:hypothetical protein Taro_041809 [Colocasia esculenta]|uniref:Uncharacterized protein n=1 Tax=Colocasia esculenta TaxID=4460 RepID=A0A843X193_COLES|nr:hypothetical protein [Colocasia esculenta]